jgi:sugar phosphate isomerase/epimerase
VKVSRQFNISTNPFNRSPISRDVFEKLSRLPVNGVEVYCNSAHFDPLDVARLKDVVLWSGETGLPIAGMHLSAGPFDAADENERQAVVERAVKQVYAAEQVGCEYGVFHPGADVRENCEEQLAIACRSIDEVMSQLTATNVKLTIENTHPQHVGGKISDIRTLMNHIPAERGGWCFDTAHANMGEEGSIAFLDSLGERIVTTHLHDNPGYPAYEDPHFPPGLGSIDWGILMPKLLAVYSGPITLECSHWNIEGDWDKFARHVERFIRRWQSWNEKTSAVFQ